MKSIAIAMMSGVALVAVAALPASGAAHPAAAAQGHVVASSWHPGAQRPAAHRSSSAATTTAKPVSTKRLIIRAVLRSDLLGGVDPTQITVSQVRVSRVDPSWAAAKITPVDPDVADPADVVLHKAKGTWRAVDLGTADVGCDLASAKVIRSLSLTCSG